MEYWHKQGGGGKRVIWLAALVLGAFTVGFVLRGCGQEAPGPAPGKPAAEAGHKHEEGEIDYWTCSMHPWIRLPDPGKCPICSMDLIPVMKRAGGAGKEEGLREVSLSPSAMALAQVELSKVEMRALETGTRLMGKVEYDETRQAYLTAWTGGRLDKLFIDHTGEVVAKGQKMAVIYSPEIYAAQAELLEAVKAAEKLKDAKRDYIRDAAARTEQAAREKLRLLGFGQGLANHVLASGKPSDHVVLTAPIGGVVIRKEVQEGAYVTTGARLFAIANLSRVWVVLRAYESDQPWIRMGADVRFEAEGIPGKTFTGKVVFIDPVMQDMTRTFRVRLDVANPEGALKPGMLVHAVQQAGQGGRKALAVPASAVLLTGKRAVVYVADPGRPGTFEGREIVVGPRSGDWYVVESGLNEGESVVTRGAFAIDSSAQLQAKPSMMNPEGGMAATAHVHGAAPGTPAAKGPGAAVPPAFLLKLKPLDEAFKAVREAVSSGDVQRYKSACEAFLKKLQAVDPAGLSGPPLGAWKEFSMLLGNDAVIGRETSSMTEARWQLKEMEGHMKRLEAAFPHQDAVYVPKSKPLAPMEAQHKIASLFKAYLDVKRPLAEDDGPGASKAAKGLAPAVAAVDAAGLSGPALEAWNKARPKLDEGVKAMAAAKPDDIEAIRAGFYAFSQGLTQAVSTLGSMGAGRIYDIYCPMAFDGEGATWLQPDPKISNPYLGPGMGDCGEVKGRVDLGE